MEAIHGREVLRVGLRERVAPVVAGDEVQVLRLRRVHHRAQRRRPRVRDRAGREPRDPVRVVGVLVVREVAPARIAVEVRVIPSYSIHYTKLYELNVRVICNNPFETDIEKVAELAEGQRGRRDVPVDLRGAGQDVELV